MAEILTNILEGFGEIFSSPFRDASIIWLLAPIILFWFIMEIYFSRYKQEKLGWNSALGYGLSMFWIATISLRTLFTNNYELFSFDKLIFLITIAIYSVFIIYISFTHKMKEKMFFIFTSPTIIYYLFGIAVLWVHGLLNISLWVVIDLVIFYIIILIFEKLLRKFIPAASEDLKSDKGIDDFGSDDAGSGLGKMGGGLGKL